MKNRDNKNLLIVAIIAMVNALGYGIIIPILYTYNSKFGLTDFQNGLLFAVFSLCQFLATPVIGRLSDRYGRRPLLLISVAGTAVSFFMMAMAPNMWWLFVARALDGITAGNIPVLSAIISDTMDPKERAKGFGVIGASFGFGFIFGPAISALTVGIADWMPFVIAGVMSVIAVIVTSIILPETNKHMGEVSHHKLFDFHKMVVALTDQNVGNTITDYLGLFTFFFNVYLCISTIFKKSIGVGIQWGGSDLPYLE
jgi:multidrug resistance protein